MKKIYILSFFVLMFAAGLSAKPYFRGAETVRPEGRAIIQKVVIDSAGYSVSSGIFSGNLEVAGESHQTGVSSDAFLQRRDENGELIWTVVISSENDDLIAGICADDEAIYISGESTVGTDFGNGVVLKDPMEQGSDSIVGFIAKYSYDGEVVWVKSIDGLNQPTIASVKLHKGFLFLGVSFYKLLFIEDSNRQGNLSSDSRYFGVIAFNTIDGKIAFYNGREQVNLFKSSLDPIIKDIAIHSTGNLYILANFKSIENPDSLLRPLLVKANSVLDDIPLTYPEQQLVGKIENADEGSFCSINSIELNIFGEPIVTGIFSNHFIFSNPKTQEEFVLAETTDSLASYVMTLTSDLDLKWKHIIDNEGFDNITGVEITEDNSVLISGTISSSKSKRVNMPGGREMFLKKLDYTGNLEWTLTGGTQKPVWYPMNDQGLDIAYQSNQDDETILLCGGFEDLAVFGTDTLYAQTGENQIGVLLNITDTPNSCLVKVGSETAEQGETAHIPVYLEGDISSALASSGSIDMKLEIAFNSTLLYPLSGDGFEIESTWVDDINLRHVVYTVSINHIGTDGLVAELPMTAGLGNAEDTPIFALYTEFKNAPFIGIDGIEDGNFGLTGLLETGQGPILVDPYGNIVKIIAAPNAMSNSGKIRVEFFEACDAKIFLADIAGNELLTIADGYYDVEAVEWEIDVSQYSPGYYFIVAMTNGEKVVTEKIQIVR
jgi:hypothetical protein